jgi:hypothetical protein
MADITPVYLLARRGSVAFASERLGHEVGF